MQDCIFCKIVKDEIPCAKVFEDEHSLAFLDITPINPGHTLLIPKSHHEHLTDIPDKTLSEMAPVIKKLAGAIKEATRADGINIGMNNGFAAGQRVMHAHIHIMPRYSHDGYHMWHGKSLSQKKMSEEAERIKKALLLIS